MLSANQKFIRNLLIVFAASIIALIASTYRLSEAPGIWFDEGFYTQMAMNFAHEGQVLQIAPGEYTSSSYTNVGYPLIAPVALSFKLFGVGVLQGRAVMAVFIILFLASSYFLIRKLFGRDIAAMTLFFISTLPLLYGNGKAILGEVPALFFFSLTLVALWHLEKSAYRDLKWYLMTGLCAGLCAATKMFFALFLFALVLTLLIRWRSIKLSWQGFLLGTAALCIPLILWVHFQLGSEASLTSLVAYYSNPYGVENVWGQIFQNMLRLVTESTPLYTTGTLLVWGVSLFLRKREAIGASELAAFIFSILVILSYLRLEGWYRYLFPATVVALLFLPQACQVIWHSVLTKIPRIKYLAPLPTIFIVLLSAGQLYQLTFTSYVARAYESTRTEDMTTLLKTLSTKEKVLLYNVPELAVLLPSSQYYQYLTPTPKITMGRENVSLLTQGFFDTVLVDSEIYRRDIEYFERYTAINEVDRYLLLKKK
jgi:4-amino-4-deoxy-L-arabinose transferase-like glycosyltransferase